MKELRILLLIFAGLYLSSFLFLGFNVFLWACVFHTGLLGVLYYSHQLTSADVIDNIVTQASKILNETDAIAGSENVVVLSREPNE